MTNPTTPQRIDDVEKARVTALMEYAARANLAADVRHADGSDYTEPSILLAGSQTYVYFDDAGNLRVSVWPDDMHWPLTRPNGAIPVRLDIEGGLVWTGEIPGETRVWAQAPAEPGTTGGHPVDALSPDAQNDLLRRIFNVLEHGNPLGQGPAGVETGSAHLNEIEVLFADRGITFTNPDDADDGQGVPAADAPPANREGSPAPTGEQLWDDNAVQFPRLIAEMNAAGFFEADVPVIAGLLEIMTRSTDLEVDDVMELVNRAQAWWDEHLEARRQHDQQAAGGSIPAKATPDDMRALVGADCRDAVLVYVGPNPGYTVMSDDEAMSGGYRIITSAEVMLAQFGPAPLTDDAAHAAAAAVNEEINLAASPAWQAFQAVMGAWVGDGPEPGPADA